MEVIRISMKESQPGRRRSEGVMTRVMTARQWAEERMYRKERHLVSKKLPL